MNPAGKRGMIDGYSTLNEHFLEITQAQRVGQIPANTLSDNINRVVQTFERFSDQGYRSGLAQKQGSLPDDRLMRQSPRGR